MTGRDDAADAGSGVERRARAVIRTTHDDPDTVAAALRPDNTDEMDATVEDGDGPAERDGRADGSRRGDRRVRTVVERDSAAGLRSTVDDYLVNLDVADRTVRHANDHSTTSDHATANDDATNSDHATANDDATTSDHTTTNDATANDNTTHP